MNSITTGGKYNYRDEWARFLSTLSYVKDDGSDELADRIIIAIGNIVGATGGALWLHESGVSFRLAAKHNYTRGECTSGDAPVLAVWLVTHDDVLDLCAGEHEDSNIDLPSWVPAPPKSWLLLPLQHRGWLMGFLVLKSHKTYPLDPEDRELLRLVASNAASYLAENEKSRQLREARAFETFTRRFAFVIHDLKNMSAQLALAHSNAGKHKDNPEFLADMLDTIGSSVTRMNGLIARLRGDALRNNQLIDVGSLLGDMLQTREGQPIHLTRPLRRLLVTGDASRLRTAVDHILDNALQSRVRKGKEGAPTVLLTLRSVAKEVRIEIADNGDGMDEAFIQERLFTPFDTTKPAGLGLGMTEAREIIEQMNGYMRVESELGSGTTVILSMPRILEEDA